MVLPNFVVRVAGGLPDAARLRDLGGPLFAAADLGPRALESGLSKPDGPATARAVS